MKTLQSHKRLFIAIPISDELKKALGKVQQNLKENSRSENPAWVSPENLHITLCFLGNVDECLIPALHEKLQEVLLSTSTFQLFFQAIKVVPARSPRMIWAEFKESDSFSYLVHSIEAAAKKYAPDLSLSRHQHIIPHITLCRFKDSRAFQNTSSVHTHEFSPEVLDVTSCQLISSQLRREGPEYAVLHSYRLLS